MHPVARKPTTTLFSACSIHPTPTGVDGEQTTPNYEHSLDLYTLVWLGCPAFQRDALPVTGEQPCAKRITNATNPLFRPARSPTIRISLPCQGASRVDQNLKTALYQAFLVSQASKKSGLTPACPLSTEAQKRAKQPALSRREICRPKPDHYVIFRLLYTPNTHRG